MTDNFNIVYNDLLASEENIMIFTIGYTVRILEYSSMTDSISGQFYFRLGCPTLVLSSTTEISMTTLITYDISSDQIL